MKKNTLSLVFVIVILISTTFVYADDGYRLWLKYDLISDGKLLNEYQNEIQAMMIQGESETIAIAKKELNTGLTGLLGETIPEVDNLKNPNTLVIGTLNHLKKIKIKGIESRLKKAGEEGFVITKASNKKSIVIIANSDIGVLYGVFHFLKLLQTRQDLEDFDIVSAPKTKLRMLNHWDMLDNSHEYNGLNSIWYWNTLPDYIRPHYIDYARANASIGINATSLNCVDADYRFLLKENLVKIKTLTDLFHPYGIKMFMSPNFNAPMILGGLDTADPNVPEVKAWWQKKVDEIYEIIPEFAGFLVKANSEGEPGPGDFGKTQADGANMFAEVLKPHDGILIWRTFVYEYDPEDRAREAYDIFKPLDEIFADNVVLQVKNGPLDFQPREPFTPLFGAMPNTPLLMELDITSGWLGAITHVVYVAPMWQEALMSDTYAKGSGSTVAKVIDGSLHDYEINGMAGVSNIILERNWTCNIFGQSNWYSFGRLAWDYNLSSEEIADEWIRMTFSNDEEIVRSVKKIMMDSREHVVNYMTPLGLNMLGGWGGFRGPWTNNSEHATWNSPYYHHADSVGLGFDRTKTGSAAVEQYFPEVEKAFSSVETCPEKYLLWFHHVPWTHQMKSGNTLWDELCYHYYAGVSGVREMRKIWNSLQHKVDKEQWDAVRMLMQMQEAYAVQWRNSCVLYFQIHSRLPIPAGLEKPEHDLRYYIVSMSRDKVEAEKMARNIIKDLKLDNK